VHTISGNSLRHGLSTKCRKCATTKHGYSRSGIYYSYIDMLRRCRNKNHPKYEKYGGRGITICARWLGDSGFKNFIADMGATHKPGLTIERKDNDGNYNPDNCCWETQAVQNGNKSDTVHLSPWDIQCIRSSSKSQRVLAAEYDCSRSVIHRVKHGKKGATAVISRKLVLKRAAQKKL
jgi:hypothetical protein